MKTFIGAAVIAAALAPWQPNAYAATMVATDVEVQPLTRAACDKVGFAWDDNGNVCDWKSAKSQSSPTLEIASKPQRATKQSTRVNGHTTRKYTHRQPRQTQVVESRPFPLFRLFRD
jgi:hypothetical protein